jgi:Zn-dependent membrane protease YugP
MSSGRVGLAIKCPGVRQSHEMGHCWSDGRRRSHSRARISLSEVVQMCMEAQWRLFFLDMHAVRDQQLIVGPRADLAGSSSK